MNTTIYLDVNENDPFIRLARSFGYSGKKFKVNIITNEYTKYRIKPSYWDGGSRTVTHLVRMEDMSGISLPTFHPFFDGPVISEEIEFIPGIMAIEICQGHYEDCTFLVHQSNMNLLSLPEKVALSADEQIVLKATDCLTSAGRKDFRQRMNFHEEKWNNAKQLLITKGFLTKNGAITPSGRNQAITLPRLPGGY